MTAMPFWSHLLVLVIFISIGSHTPCSALTNCDRMKLEDSQIAQCVHRELEFTRNCEENQKWPEQTIAEIRCRPYWKSTGDSDKIKQICLNGKWEAQLESSLTCKIACGVAGEEDYGKNQKMVLKGPWPWHVGIYTEVLLGSGDFRYTCGGTLISTRAILTAAQCVTFPQQTVEYRAKDIHILVGDFDYFGEQSEAKMKSVQKIVLHPDYNPSTYEANIAVIWLTENVKINPFVHPICLPRPDEEIQDEAKGKMVVYDNGTARAAVLPLLEPENCQQRSATHALLTRPTTFCTASNRDAEVCNPIGGSGIAFETRLDRSNTKWTLQGIRIGVPIQDCHKPVVYTRVSKYQRWISNELKNREPPLYIEKVSIRPTERTTTSRAVPTIIVAPVTTTTTRSTTPKAHRRPEDDPLISGDALPVVDDEIQNHPANALYINPKKHVQGDLMTDRKSTTISGISIEATSTRPAKPSPSTSETKRPGSVNQSTPNRSTKKPVTSTTTSTAKPSSTTHRSTKRPMTSSTTEDLFSADSSSSGPRRGTDRPKLKYRTSKPLCPALPFSEGVVLSCDHGKDEEPDECQRGGWNGTRATYRCEKYYRSVYGTNSIQKTCNERRLWLPAKEFGCKLECGLSSRPKISYIVHGTVSDRVSWPWHVAIFRRTEGELTYYCGGTLISRNVIITAAHCVTQPTTSRIFDDEFQVILAAVSSVYSENQADRHARTYGVKNISIPDSYNPVTFESDIALMQLKEDVELSDYIKPICWPSKNNFEYSQLELIHLAHDSVGYTVGFGLDETGEIGNSLRETTLPYVTHKACGSALDRFPTSTQFCAGYRNGTSVCNGDSGGGIYFVDESNIYKRFILQGIISNGDPNEGSKLCNNNNYAVFTKVSSFSNWIERYLDAVENERLIFFASFASHDDENEETLFRSAKPRKRR